jgi:prevent-host-death family protein
MLEPPIRRLSMASKHAPQEKVMNLTETRQHFSQLIAEVARGDSYIVVEKNGTASAVIVEPEEFRRYQRFSEEQRQKRERLFERLARLGDAFEEVSDEELERELRQAQAQVKDEMAREHPPR